MPSLSPKGFEEPLQKRTGRQVGNVPELLSALNDATLQNIVVAGVIAESPTIRLREGVTLCGLDEHAGLQFAPGTDGVQLSADNALHRLTIEADLDRRAVFNDTTIAALGILELADLTVRGVIQILARDGTRNGHIEAHRIDVVAADARAFAERPKGYGVEVIPGAFSVWNQQADPGVTITADLTAISVGRAGAPVRGSGIFVSGAGDVGGRLMVRRLETAAVFSDAGIAPGTPDRISGGVFTVYGAHVAHVRNRGPVTTYGPNDMVLDNWGNVDRWTADEAVTSYGPSGIGFVNFGTINTLEVNAPIETFGQGARGYNVYAGTVQSAEFERIVTHADGAVGLQLSQPVGRIKVRRGIVTYGGRGNSLVKGVVMQLPATAFSVKPGGSAERVDIQGGLTTHGKGVEPLELHGSIGALDIHDGFAAVGGGFDVL